MKSLTGSLTSMTRLPYNEFSNDMEYQPSMDIAWHKWLQPEWDKERKAWLAKEKEKDENSANR